MFVYIEDFVDDCTFEGFGWLHLCTSQIIW